jgi:hypothetical protein
VRVADYPAYARERGNLFGGALRVTAGDYDLAGGILPVNTADGGARVLVGRGGHRAGIQDYDFGLRGTLGPLQAALAELALDGGSVSLGGAAAKILYVEGSHDPMVNRRREIRPRPRRKSSRSHLPLLLKTFSTEDGAALRGSEGDGGVLAALRATGAGFDAGIALRSGGGTEYGDALGFAAFAPLGFVLELLIVEEQLFPGREDEIGAAVNTVQHLVLEFH